MRRRPYPRLLKTPCLLFCWLGVSILLPGCFSHRQVIDITELTPPRKVVATVTSGEVVVRWEPSFDESRPDFAGYSVYVATRSLMNFSFAAGEGLPLPREVGQVHELVIGELIPGERYFIQIRSRLDNGQLSVASLPEVTIELPRADLR